MCRYLICHEPQMYRREPHRVTDAPIASPIPSPSAAAPLSPRRLLITAALAVIMAVVLLPADGPISQWMRSLKPSGDTKRELEVLQQFGDAASVIIVLLVMMALDPARLRRMLDWALAIVTSSLAVLALKMTIGRPRPQFHDPLTFLGPFGHYIHPTKLNDDGTSRIVGNAIGFGNEQLWSMPSNHTAAAFVFAVFLTHLYPRLKPMAFGLAALVGACRILFGAHYLTDVLVGGLLGWSIASFIIPRGLGVRALDAIWITWIDRNATPAWKGEDNN